MDTMPLAERTLTELDFARLKRLLAAPGITHRQSHVPLLNALDGAELVASRTVPPDLVTMNSRVELVDAATGLRQVLTLCYPEDSEPMRGSVSVLSPVGSALLGLRAGATASWSTPGGNEIRMRIVAVLFQPEACGDYVL